MSWPPHAAVGAAVGFQEAFELLRYLDYEIVSNALVLTFGSRYHIPCRLIRATSGVSLGAEMTVARVSSVGKASLAGREGVAIEIYLLQEAAAAGSYARQRFV